MGRPTRRGQKGPGGNKMGHLTLPMKSMNPYSIKQIRRTRSNTTLAGAPSPYTNGLWQVQVQHEQDGTVASASYECGAAIQTARHMAGECPLQICNGRVGQCSTQLLRDLQVMYINE